MKTLPYLTVLLAGAISIFSSTAAMAGQGKELMEATAASEDDFPFIKGTKEVQLMAGPVISFNTHSHLRPAVNYFSEDLRFGWMLTTPRADSHCWLRGNTELLAEVFGGEIYQGPGKELFGGTLLVRYNLAQPGAKLHPYAQLGAGALYNDIYKSHPQRVVGQAFEFNLQAGLGLHYLLTPRCSISLEADYRHISNANLASRNVGLNSVAGLVGLSFFY